MFLKVLIKLLIIMNNSLQNYEKYKGLFDFGKSISLF
ncbi:hypothetical protein EZS27_020856 [termite gut metagenome]|uniref:Uncharacterized protein n=1 Tax=termite gut metagenome TaxID=433724 RepID=A0A5J4RBC1_9ZZZZ